MTLGVSMKASEDDLLCISLLLSTRDEALSFACDDLRLCQT